MKKFDTLADKIFVAIIYIILALLFVIMLYPFWETVVLSLSPREDAIKQGVHIWTSHPTLNAYKQVFAIKEFWNAMKNSVVRVILGTMFTIVFTSLTAYPLTKENLPGRKIFMNFFIFTMLFNGGMIPTYLVIKTLKLTNTIWSLVIPGCVGAYNLIIMRNFISSIPACMAESALIDGASEFKIWYKIILPLSKPVLATVALWSALGHWNAYLDSLIYITDQKKYVLSVILRRVLISNESNMFFMGDGGASSTMQPQTEETIKSTMIMFSILPIAVIYPFLQKYFSKGIMLGAVKG